MKQGSSQERISLVHETWDQRYAQDNEAFLTSLGQLLNETPTLEGRIPTPEGFLPLLEKTDAKFLQEIVLLQVSSLRLQQRHAEATNLLKELESFLERRSLPRTMRLDFELGNQALMHSQYALALEAFSFAVSKATDPFQKLCSLTNQLLCFEELGFSSSGLLSQIEELIQHIPPHRTGLRGVKRQLEARRVRQLYHQGKIADAIDAMTESKTDGGNYLKLYYQELPFLNGISQNEKNNLLLCGFNYTLSPYRSRTLLGIYHPDDAYVIKPSEWVDRFYLWTWRWLAGCLPLDTLLVHLRGAQAILAVGSLTVEDSQMLRNALLWLSLLDPFSLEALKPVLRRLQILNGHSHPIFEVEYLVVSYFHAKYLKDGAQCKSLRRTLNLHPLFRSNSLVFSSLVNAVEKGDAVAPSLQYLVDTLQDLFDSPDPWGKASYVVDLDKQVIRSKATKNELISESACRALHLLHQHEVVKVEEFARVVYGLTAYDSLIHSSKIAHLLTRLKKLLGKEFKLGTKGGHVFLQGPLEKIVISRKKLQESSLSQSPEWKELLVFKEQSKKEAVPSHFPESVSRQSLEKWLMKSRATVNRLLLEWEQEGLVRREGSSRSTRYKISPILREKLDKKRMETK